MFSARGAVRKSIRSRMLMIYFVEHEELNKRMRDTRKHGMELFGVVEVVQTRALATIL